ncbi:STAS domain-containing protein [Streptomyces sp. ODS05-4]|uniref:STAS domain-containing protein n=1 Tax=Streptomyces sp. ODS05-4 TaxID=2944939 RepID=UPI0027E40C1E|nr:STAS domain-containing protein [Streptomyces sp. ODS05-4]
MIHSEGVPPVGELVVTATRAGRVHIITVVGDVDAQTAVRIEEVLAGAYSSEPPLIVMELSGVGFIDSSGIRVLFTGHATAQDRQGWLRVARASQQVMHVVELVRLDSVIDCYPTLEQALHH